jgi:hypothetical protein
MNEIDKAVSIEIMIKNMTKNQRNAIDITLLPNDKYQGQTVEQIAEDLKRLMDEDNGLCN